jgi:hypothetical protein
MSRGKKTFRLARDPKPLMAAGGKSGNAYQVGFQFFYGLYDRPFSFDCAVDHPDINPPAIFP